MVRRITLLTLLILCSTHTAWPRIGSLAQYERERRELHSNLARIGIHDHLQRLSADHLAPTTPSTTPPDTPAHHASPVAPTAPAAPSSPARTTPRQPNRLSPQEEQVIGAVINATVHHYDESIAQKLAQELYMNHALLNNVLDTAAAHGASFAQKLANKAFLNKLIGINSPVPSTPGSAASRPTVQPPKPQGFFGHATAFGRKIGSFMGKIKNTFSVKAGGSRLTSFVSKLFEKFWYRIWRVVGYTLSRVIGKEKIYEIDSDGNIKVDVHGHKVPKILPQKTMDPATGEEVTHMAPSKWYGIIENPNSLLGTFAMAGIDRATKSTLHSMDRLLLRPLASRFLQIPLWKLSRTHYLLHLHQRHYPHEAALNPKLISKDILSYAQKQPKMLASLGLPKEYFDIRRIAKEKNADKKANAILTAVTNHMWSVYEGVWKEAKITKKVGDANVADVDKAHTGQERQEDDSLLSKVFDEAKHIGKASFKGKVLEGPLVQYYIYANLAMSIPRTLFDKFGIQKELKTESDSEASINKRSYIDILDRTTQEIRTHYAKKADLTDRDKNPPEALAFTFKNGADTYTVTLYPSTQKRLLEAQEKLVKQYSPFLGKVLNAGDSYEIYLKKLLLPRILAKVLPKAAQQKLKMTNSDGTTNLALVAARIDYVEKRFNRVYQTVQAITNLLALIKRFENIDQFAGHYTEIADTLDQFFYSLSNLGGSFGIQKDDWRKRRKNVRRQLTAKLLSKEFAKKALEKKKKWPYSWLGVSAEKAFTPGQRQRIKVAMAKAGVNAGILMLNNADQLKQYVRDGNNKEALTHTNDAEGTNTFARDGATAAEEASRIRSGIQRQAARYRYRPDDDNHITLHTFKKWVNAEFIKPEHAATKEDAAARATDVIMHTLGTLAASKTRIEDDFYTDGAKLDTDEEMKKNAEKFATEMQSKLRMYLSHARAGIEAAHNLYRNYGLREILTAFDEHFLATGEPLTQIPMGTIGKIALREGLGHAVGLGAEKLLKKAMAPMLAQVAQLQGNPLLGGPAVQNLINQKLGAFTQSRGTAYQAARDVMRNVMTYGTTALKPENLLGSVSSKLSGMMPGGAEGMQAPGSQGELMIHAKMAGESGKQPMPAIAKKMKDAGLDPQMFANMGDEGFDGQMDDMAMPNMPGTPPMPPMSGPSPQIISILQRAQQVMTTKGRDATLAFLRQAQEDLGPQDKQVLEDIIRNGISEQQH